MPHTLSDSQICSIGFDFIRIIFFITLLHVCFAPVFAGKRFIAELAQEWLCTRMSIDMTFEMVVLFKTSTTYFAVV